MVDIVISVAAKVAEYMLYPIFHPLSHLFKHHRNFEDLIQKIVDLECSRERLGNLVEDARRQGDEIIPHVQEWLQEAEGIIQKKEGFAEDEKQASKSCFYLKSRYRLSKKAKKQGVDIDVKLQQAGNFGDRVSRRPSPPPLICSASSQNSEAFPSRQSIFDQIMEALSNEDTSMVGVWGMGGVGKTTLALQVAKRAEEEKLFHKVVMASSISQTPNNSEIQREIARTLGLTFSEGEDRAVHLQNSLKNQETILVILDDIWNKLDLAKIGIPYGHGHRGCKLLLTSRDHGVLDSDMEVQHVFQLPHLNAEEAWDLFKRTAGDFVESPAIRSIANEIVKHCEGLPIAIVTIGNALKKKNTPVWKNALEELKNAAPTNLRGVTKKVYSCLELSYNHLESGEAKSLFLLCGLLEDAHISMDHLLIYCMGLNLFEGLFSWEKAINKVITLVESLKASSLLLGPDQDGKKGRYGSMFFDDAFVKIHDIVRDVARSIASKDAYQYVVRAVAELRQWEMRTEVCRNYRRISLKCSDKDELLPQRLACPELELFLLNSSFDQGKDMRIPYAFFQGITNLSVLHLSGLSLGPSLVFPLNLSVLCLNYCQLYDLSWAALGELKSLQALSLAGSNIEKLPKEMMQLSGLRVLDLRDCGGLRKIPRDVISSLSRLEYLSLKRCANIEWERHGVNHSGERNKACLSELKHLPQLKTLEVEVSDPKMLPEDELLFHDVNLTRYSIVIDTKQLQDEYERGVSRNLVVKGSVRAVLKCLSKLFTSCQGLELEELGEIKEVVYELDSDYGFVELKNLSISNCPAIECILHSRDYQWVPPCNILCMLERLNLNSLNSLEAVCRGPIPLGCFRNLRLLQLSGCERLKYVFSSQDPTMELAFPRLQSLKLRDVPELISFSSSTTTATTAGSQGTIAIFNLQVSFPVLKSIVVSGVINTRALWEKELAADSFSKVLTLLKVESCPKLQNVFPLYVTKALVQLWKIQIFSCHGVETIVGSEDESAAVPPLFLFPNVTILSLRSLPQLNRFCSSRRITLRWPALKSLGVFECRKVEGLFEGIGANYDQLFIPIQQPLFLVDEYAFPALESISIEGLDSLRALWYSPQISADFFPRLKKLEVHSCRKLQNIFPLSVAKALGQLQQLSIKSCEAVEEIVTCREDETIDSLSLFPNLTTLVVRDLPQLKNFSSKGFASRWPRLKSLQMERCCKVEILFVQETVVGGGGLATTEIQQPFFLPKDAFPALESTSILSLDSLRALWYNTQISADFFTRLKELKVDSCRKLHNIFPLSVAKALSQLQQLSIKSCEAMEEIVTSHEDEITASLSLFPNLTTLVVRDLPQLKKFCSERFALRWPRLKSLELRRCDKVEILFVQETGVEGGLAATEIQPPFFFLQKDSFPTLECMSINHLDGLRALWGSPQISADFFPRLQNLRVISCGKLVNVFPFSVAKALAQLQQLHNLESLTVGSCGLLNEIIQGVDGEQPATNDDIDFPILKRLKLANLPNLKSFCSTTCTFRFPSLEDYVVKRCPQMGFFCIGDLHTPRLKSEEMKHPLKQMPGNRP